MTVVHRARCRAGVRQPIRLPRPADGGSMMPAVAALRTLGADLCAATPKAWPVTITPLDEQSRSGVRAGVFSERTAKFAADMPPGIDRP